MTAPLGFFPSGAPAGALWGRVCWCGQGSGPSRPVPFREAVPQDIRVRVFETSPDPRPSASPAALAPLLQVRALGAQRRVVAVAGVEPGLVGEPVEQLGGDVVDQLPEGVVVVEGVADAAGEERVAGEEMRVPVRVVVEKGDGAG